MNSALDKTIKLARDFTKQPGAINQVNLYQLNDYKAYEFGWDQFVFAVNPITNPHYEYIGNYRTDIGFKMAPWVRINDFSDIVRNLGQ